MSTHNAPKLIERLRELGAKCEADLPALNFGGCGVYALETIRALKRHNIEACAITDYSNSHVITQFKHAGRVYLHDSESTDVETRSVFGHNGVYAGMWPLTLNEQELAELVDNKQAWNPEFNRREGLPIIRENIRHILERAE